MSTTRSRTSDYERTHVRYVGADGDFLYFVTESWSRATGEDGKVKEYDVSVSKRDGFITCTCPDAQMRGKVGDVQNLGKGHVCKHVARLVHMIGAVLPRPNGQEKEE